TEHLALLDFETNILQSPEFFHLIALHDLSATGEVGRLSCKVSHLTANHVAQGRVTFALGRAVSDQIALREILNGNDDVGHEKNRLNQIGKTPFHVPERADPQPHKKSADSNTHCEAGQIERTLTAE